MLIEEYKKQDWKEVPEDIFIPVSRFIEEIGTYNPVANPAEVKINKELAIKWLKNGAEPTDTVRNLLSQTGVLKEYHEMRMGK